MQMGYKTTVIKQPSLLSRLLGNEWQILAEHPIFINSVIKAVKYEVTVSGIHEDKGLILCFPVADAHFSLQLQYCVGSLTNTAAVYVLEFLPDFFTQFPPAALLANQPFRFDETSVQPFQVCSKSVEMLDNLMRDAQGTTFSRLLKRVNVSLSLLTRALECITIPFESCQVPACKFLGDNQERRKIEVAVQAIHDNLHSPLTIKELARKAAINECYLKKGFKTVTGKTIHDYQQDLRISKASEMLSRQGMSVTEVAAVLGYSSISHFSAAFKRVTGLKPCELLS